MCVERNCAVASAPQEATARSNSLGYFSRSPGWSGNSFWACLVGVRVGLGLRIRIRIRARTRARARARGKIRARARGKIRARARARASWACLHRVSSPGVATVNMVRGVRTTWRPCFSKVFATTSSGLG